MESQKLCGNEILNRCLQIEMEQTLVYYIWLDLKITDIYGISHHLLYLFTFPALISQLLSL